jgi:hypothetical protein
VLKYAFVVLSILGCSSSDSGYPPSAADGGSGNGRWRDSNDTRLWEISEEADDAALDADLNLDEGPDASLDSGAVSEPDASLDSGADVVPECDLSECPPLPVRNPPAACCIPSGADLGKCGYIRAVFNGGCYR